MSGRPGRGAVGAFGIVLIFTVGLIAASVGAIVCHDEVQSSEQAPNLCGSVGTDTALWLPPLIGAGVVLLLLFSRLRTTMFALATVLIVAAEAGLILMWALVAHGTIHY